MDAAPQEKSRRKVVTTVVTAALGVGVMVAVFFFLFPKFADYQSAFEQMGNMPAWAVALLVVVSAANILIYPMTAKAAMPHLPYRAAFNSRQASFLISNVVPGGGPVAVATQYSVLAGYGVPRAKAVAAVSADGVWTYLIILGAPSISVALLALDGMAATGFTTAAIVGLAVVIVSLAAIAVTLRSTAGAEKVGKFAQKPVDFIFSKVKKTPPNVVGQAVEFHEHASEMVGERWRSLTVTSLAAQFLPFFVLLVALAGLGEFPQHVNFLAVFAAFNIALLATMIPLTPGGLGTADAALVALLIAFGADSSAALAADMIWRLAWFVPQLLSGAVALGWYFWDKRKIAADPSLALDGVPE